MAQGSLSNFAPNIKQFWGNELTSVFPELINKP